MSLLVALCLALAGLAGTSTNQPPAATLDTPPARTPQVGPDSQLLVLGDSITWQTCGGDRARFPLLLGDFTQHDHGCYGWPGATTADMRWLITDQAHARRASGVRPKPAPAYSLRSRLRTADVLVIELGTNEAGREAREPYDATTWPRGDGPIWQHSPVHQPIDNGAFQDQIEWYMRQADGRPVLWMNLACRSRSVLLSEQMKEYNAVLDAAAKRWPNLHIVDWQAAVHGTPALLRDEVHLSDAGVQKRWELIKRAYAQLRPSRR